MLIFNGDIVEDTYFLVHSRAVASYLVRSVLYRCAMSGTNGSSGLGSVSIEQIESRTVRLRVRVCNTS